MIEVGGIVVRLTLKWWWIGSHISALSASVDSCRSKRLETL